MSARDTGAPVTHDYAVPTTRSRGDLQWIRIDLGDDDHGHLIDPDKLFEVAMARQ